MLRATWYKGTAQLLSLTELKSHLFELYFIGWTIKPMKEGRKPEYPEKTPGDELQKMPHTTARRFKPQTRLEPSQQHWWQARKADMLTVTPRVAFFVQREELALVIYWQVLDVWVLDLVRTRSCILSQSGKYSSDFQLCDQICIGAGFCQGFVQSFPDCFPFIQIVLTALLDAALE